MIRESAHALSHPTLSSRLPTEIDLILARAGDPAQIVRLKRTEVEAMEGEVEHAIQAQLAQINRAETDLMNVENQRADQLQQTLIQFDHDLRNAAYLLPEETQHMVQQHTVEFNQQVLDNRKALLQFCTQIRMARADRQDKALKELVRLRREVWSPERTQHLLDDFQATMATFSSTKEREALEAFHVRYDEIYVEQLNVIRQVAKMNPAQMSLDGFRVAIERAEAITTKDFQQHFEKLFRDLRANDDKIHTLQKEKVEQLTVALYDCNNGKVPANAKKMIDSLYDKDKTVRMATIQRLAIESITQQTRQNADSLLRFCEYARRTFQIWEEHQREISKLPETLTKNLEEIRAMHGSDLVRQEEEMRKIVLDMRNKDDNVSALQTSMEKLRISLDCIKEVYEAQHETCVRTMGAHTAIIEQQLLDCKTELFTFLGVSAPNVNDTTPVQSTEALAADDVVSGATLDGVAMEPVVAVVIPQKLAHREPRRQSARGRRKAAQVVAHSSRMHNDDMHFAKYDTDFGSYQLAHTDLLFIQQQLHRWQLFMTESKRRILIDPEEIEAERLRKEEEAKQAALTNRPVKSDRGTAPIDINTILEYVPPTLKPVAAMPTTTKMIEGGAKKLETPYLRVKLLDTSVIQELQETLQRTWIGFLEELETSKGN